MSNFEMPRPLREACMAKAKSEGKSFQTWCCEQFHRVIFPHLPFSPPDPEPENFRASIRQLTPAHSTEVPAQHPVQNVSHVADLREPFRPVQPDIVVDLEKRCDRCKRLGRKHCPICKKEVEQ
jgi:hypothetical protein